MNREEISVKVKEELINVLLVEKEDCIDDAGLSNDLGADSLDVLEVAMNLEKEFNIVIPDSSIEDAKTVKDYIDLVEKLV